MQHKAKLLKRKIETVYGGNPWYGKSIKSILNEIDSENVFVSAGRNAHTIAELVSHMIAWGEIVLRRLMGDSQFKISQKNTFRWERIDKNKKTAWVSLLNAFEDNRQMILKELDKIDDEYLGKKVSRKKYNMEFLIEGKIQHDIYHLGQIAQLNKLLKR